jgi:hypothetical protein
MKFTSSKSWKYIWIRIRFPGFLRNFGKRKWMRMQRMDATAENQEHAKVIWLRVLISIISNYWKRIVKDY